MDFIESIKYRKSIDAKSAKREKLTKEEKKWCETNPIFNEKYQEPYYRRDIVELSTNCLYQVTVTLEKFCSGMLPLIGIPLGEGYIVANIVDINTMQSKKAQTKILGVLLSEQYPISSFTLNSKIGYMSIEYQCQYFDTKMNITKIEPSILNFAYGMKKQELAENKVRYSCKHPLNTEMGSDDFVFVIEWKEKTD